MAGSVLAKFADKVVEKIADYTLAPIFRQIGYLLCYRCNINQLNDEVEKLHHARENVQEQINAALNNDDEIHVEVSFWLSKADNIIFDAKKFREDDGHAKAGCSTRGFPNFFVRHRLGRRAKKMAIEVANIHGEKKFDQVSYRIPPKPINTSSNTLSYESFGSRNNILEDIMQSLSNPDVKMIGVYGLGGVGKTTLAKEVARKTQEDEQFDNVIMVSVTRNPDMMKIQGQIADVLGLKFEEETESGRARRLLHKLNKDKEKKRLIILDDLWASIDLIDLGIPSGDDHKELKILLTSRSEDILSKQMKVTINFPLGVLSESEAEALFKKASGLDDPVADREVLQIASEVAKKCGKLPLAVVALASALRDKSLCEWRDALLQLNRPSVSGLQEAVETSIKLSYDHLESDELKSTFLLCARLSNDPFITDLLKYCMGLGLFLGVYTMREARDRIHTYIRKLKASGLLQDSSSSDRFAMNDVVRDVAISIASMDHHVLAVRNGKLDEWPDAAELENCTAIYLHYSNIIRGELPEGLHCPRLKTFHIDNKDDFLQIPDEFFEGMSQLKVLVLTGLQLKCLPSSIKLLKKLRMLCLERCVLENITFIGELKNLRILSLSGSKIKELPVNIMQLGDLQLLDLSWCPNLVFIPHNVLSSLSSLEELYMGNSFRLWASGEKGEKSHNASLTELTNLHNLSALDIHISHETILPRGFIFDSLERYKIFIGDFWVWSSSCDDMKTLKLDLNRRVNIHFENGLKMLFRTVEVLYLCTLDGVKNVLYELNWEGFPWLQRLYVQDNNEILYLFDSTEWLHPHDAFPRLHSLVLQDLSNFEKICIGNPTGSSFCNLKSIDIRRCNKLKNIFSFCMLRSTSQLETIKLHDCENLEEIASAEMQQIDDADDVAFRKEWFPQLRNLNLNGLPALLGFCTDAKKQVGMDASLSEINMENKCACSSPLFDEKLLFPKLESLYLSHINLNKIWIDQLISSSLFPKLTHLSVGGCGSLSYLLSLPVARSLVNLKFLSVFDCSMMEEILLREVSAFSSEEIAIFPNLENMYVANMENLTSIWNQQLSRNSLGRLKRIAIKDCGKLVTIFPSYMLGTCQNIREFLVNGCGSVEEVFDVQGLDIEQMQVGYKTKLETMILDNLPKLKHVWNKDPGELLQYKDLRKIHVIKCVSLINIFPVSVATRIEKLEKFRVISCYELKEIVAMKEGMEMTHVRFNFPQATYMCFRYLNNLKCFYSGIHDIEVPNLKTLVVHLCPRVQSIGPETTLLDGATAVKKPMFSFKKVTANLEELRVINQDDAKWILYGKYPVDLFCNLKALQLGILEDYPAIFPYWFLYRMPYLEELSLATSSFHEIFPVTGRLHAQEKYFGTVVRLKKFELWFLKNLVNICKDGCQVDPILHVLEHLSVVKCDSLINLLPPSASLYHLTHLEVNECEGLVHLIAPSTAKSLGQLVTLRITNCQALKEIVAKEVGDDREDEIEFGQLKTLELVRLGSLKSFCSSRHCSFKFLLLEKLLVEKCPKMGTRFSGGVATAPKLRKLEIGEKDEDADDLDDNDDRNVEGKYQEGDLNATIGKLFVDKVVPNSDSLSISCNDALRLIEFLEGPLHNVKSLELRDGTDVFPLEFLRVVPKLEKLVVTSSFFYEIFSSEENLKGESSEILVQCKELELADVQNLKDIRLGQPKLEPILEKLEKLCIERCSSLISLAPSRVSFPNLTLLYISNCEALLNLFTSTTAKSLVNLGAIHIAYCDSLNEVITEEGGESEGDEIVFDNLRVLFLISLPRLACFWEGNSPLNFPILKRMVVINCPSMKTFSQGVIVSPQLQAVSGSINLTEKFQDQGVWDGDLNTTITNLFKKQAEKGSDIVNVEKIMPRDNNEIEVDMQQ